MREKREMLNITPGCAQRILGIDVPQYLDLARDVVELLGHVLADLRLGAAAGARAVLLRYVMEHVATRQMITEATSAVPLAVLPRHGLTGITFGGFGRNARHGLRVEEMALPRSLWQSLPPRPNQQPLQGQVLFLQTGIGTLELLGGRDELVELAFEIAESLQRGTEPVLAGRQIIRDGIDGIGHTHRDASDRALFDRARIF
jgi:hypothetical protein